MKVPTNVTTITKINVPKSGTTWDYNHEKLELLQLL